MKGRGVGGFRGGVRSFRGGVGGSGDASKWGADCGGDGGGDDGEGQEGDVVLFREADGGAGGGEGGAKSPVEVGEGDAEVDDIIGGGGLEGVCLEDCVLGHVDSVLVFWRGEKRAVVGEAVGKGSRRTIARTLCSLVSNVSYMVPMNLHTHAHT